MNMNMNTNQVIRDIYQTARRDPTLQGTLDVAALLRRANDDTRCDLSWLLDGGAISPSDDEDDDDEEEDEDEETQANTYSNSSVERRLPTLATYQHDIMDRLNLLVDHGFSVLKLPAAIQALSTYRLIDNLDELRIGRYTRWASRIPPDPQSPYPYSPPKLNPGGIVYNITFDAQGTLVHVYCVYNKRTVRYRFDNMFTFQKFTTPELCILQARNT